MPYYVYQAETPQHQKQMNFQVIDAKDQTVLETWPTFEQAQQACNEICQRWGEGEAFVKAV